MEFRTGVRCIDLHGNGATRQGDLTKIRLTLKVNGEIRQHGSSSDMIFDIPTLISYLSQQFTLTEGDLIFTGTPEGVSAVQAGDMVEATLNDYESTVTVTIA